MDKSRHLALFASVFMTSERKHFSTLHGLRGVAAIIVVLYHVWPFVRGRQEFTLGAYLAVDLFFILSGFVLAHAYDRRLAGGMSFKAFALSRMIRLSPLYYLALLIALFGVGAGALTGARYSLSLLHSTLTALAWLPTPPRISFEPHELFPLNGPAWSLLFEVAVNFAYALVGLRLGQRATALVVLASGAALVMAALHYGSLNYGSSWTGALVGVARVVFSFSLGVLMCRALARVNARTCNWRSLAILAGAGLLLVIPAKEHRALFDLLVVFVAWPLVIYCGARIEAHGSVRDRLQGLGDLSYALYATHAPLFSLAAVVCAFAFGQAWNDHGYEFALAVVPLAVVFAAFAHRAYDVPVRRVLNHWARPRPAAA